MDATSRNSAFYNSKAQEGSKNTFAMTMKQRSESDTIHVKEFHNAIKRALLLCFCANKQRLLDIGCGRGGDINKWLETGLTYVKGIDASITSVQECRSRFYNCRNRDKLPKLEASFDAMMYFGHQDVQELKLFDCVSAMFSLHYFFESEQMLHQTIKNISNNLKPGGVFFGCLPDGKRILATLDDQTEYQSTHFHLIKRFSTEQPQCFGSAYSFSLRDSVTENTQGKEDGGSMEYLVFSNVLVQVAAEYGLEPILDYGPFLAKSSKPHLAKYQTWSDLFEASECTTAVWKHFSPQFSEDMGGDLELVSRLFCAFAFCKQTPRSEESAREVTNKKRARTEGS